MIDLCAAQAKKKVSFCEKLLDYHYEPSRESDDRGEEGIGTVVAVHHESRQEE